MLIKRTILSIGYSLLLLLSYNSSKAMMLDIIKTKLQITVLNNLGNIEKGATIQLFKTEEDYEQSVNAIQTKVTDDKGKATFDNLEERDYYVLVEKGDMSNTDGGTKTEKLKAHRINKITIIISE